MIHREKEDYLIGQITGSESGRVLGVTENGFAIRLLHNLFE